MLGNAFLVFLAKKFTIVAEVRRFCCFVTNKLAASFRTRISKYSVSGSLICLVIDSNNIMLGNAMAKLYNTGPLQKRKIRGNTVRGPAVGQNIKSSATAVRGPAVTNSSIKQVTPWIQDTEYLGQKLIGYGIRADSGINKG